jgi:hypothetical protein
MLWAVSIARALFDVWRRAGGEKAGGRGRERERTGEREGRVSVRRGEGEIDEAVYLLYVFTRFSHL